MTGDLEGEENRVLVRVVPPWLTGRNCGEQPPLAKGGMVAPEASG